MSRRRVSKEPKRMAVTVVLSKKLRDALDVVAEEIEEDRSYVIEEMCKFCLIEEHLNELFPYEEDGDQEEDSE